MSISNAQLRLRSGSEIGDRETRVRGAEVGGQHDPRLVVEGQPGGPPAAGRLRVAGFVDEPGSQQRVDALGNGRTREPGLAGERGASHRVAAANQPEDGAGAAARSWMRAWFEGHGWPK